MTICDVSAAHVEPENYWVSLTEEHARHSANKSADLRKKTTNLGASAAGRVQGWESEC